jgi:extracellular elastinolytic metalloproteinase
MAGTRGSVIGAAWLLAAVLAAGVVGSKPAGGDSTASAGEIVSLNERGEFDIARSVRHSTLPAPIGALALAPGGRALRGAVVKMDGLTGSANRVRVPEGFLTGPSGAAPQAIARGFLSGNPGLFKLTPADVTGLQVARDYASTGMGMRHLTLQPVHAGIPVLQAEVKFDLRTTGELISVSGSAVPDLRATVNTVTPTLTAAQALHLANRAVGVKGNALSAAVTPVAQFRTGTRRPTLFAASAVYDRAPVVQLTYLPTGRGQTRLAWETTLWRRGEEDVYQVLIDAVTGRTLFVNNYTDQAHGPVYDREAPQDGTPFNGATPAVLDRVDKTFDGSEFFNNGDPHRDWWAGAAQTTTDDNNTTTGSFRDLQNFLVATAAAGGNFTFTLSLAQAPSTYTKAAIVNEFYWNNRCHDIWYGFGFNEAAGNFQKSNFGLGGSGNDPVLATTQFGADAQPPKRNNANFSTPPDGSQPVMRMFEFDETNPFRDSDLAADVIAHEYGHGVTNRLIGNGGGLGGFQGGAMGEGLSDFQSLMVHSQPTDPLGLPYPIGGYVINNFAGGIRSQPYSPNRSSFTRTFLNIGDQIPNFGPEVHLAGEIMCNAVFDAFGRFTNRLGAAGARTRAMQLFINACKLCPSNPTYLDFRDALLTADANGFANADKDDIWAAFAEHGMGVNASTSGVDDVNPVEDFSTPNGNPPDTPPAPANFNASLIDATHVDVSWSDVTGETGYLLEAAVNNEPFFSLDNITIPANTTLVHLVLTSGFNPGDLVSFRVRAKSANGNSPPSNVDSVTLPGGLPVPAPPSDFSVELLTNTTAQCAWSDNSGNETKFVLEASINLGPFNSLPQINIPANSTSVQIQFTGFSPGDQISLRIHAENASGPSLPSNSDTIVVPGGPQPPGTPGSFGASLINKNKQVNCHWSDVSGEDGYRVELSVNGGGFAPLNPAAKANKTSLKLTLPAVQQGDQLTLRVRSFNQSGSSQPSNSVVLNIPFTKPAAPKSLTATPNAGTDGSTKITLTYVDKASNEQGFRVELQPPGQAFQEIGTVGPNVPVVEISNLTPNTLWKFRVRAFNTAGNSAYSNVAQAKTKP